MVFIGSEGIIALYHNKTNSGYVTDFYLVKLLAQLCGLTTATQHW